MKITKMNNPKKITEHSGGDYAKPGTDEVYKQIKSIETGVYVVFAQTRVTCMPTKKERDSEDSHL